MRVLIVYHAGATQNARHIYRALASSGPVELTVVVPTEVHTDPVYNAGGRLCVDGVEQNDGYRLVPVPLRDAANYWGGFESRGLRHVLRNTRPDVIHVLDEPVSGYLFQVVWEPLVFWRRSKVLFYGFENRPYNLRLRSRIKWFPTWSQMAGGAGANSECLENIRRAGFPRDRPLERIFWGISTEQFRPIRDSSLKDDLRLDCRHIVGFVGRLTPEKGIDVLFSAMRSLPGDVHCLMVGDGPLRSELEAKAREVDLRGRVRFCGAVDQETLVKYMNCMDILALPSLTVSTWKEQYGRVIAEAMACGVPVVGSDSGAIPEVIGQAGLVAPEGNATALAEALRTALYNRGARERFRVEGLKRAEQELSTRAMGQRLLQLYERIVRD